MEKIENFLKKHNKEFLKIANIDDEVKKNLVYLYKLLINIKKNKKKIIVVGNGASAAIASHFCVDMTKNGGIRSVNFNESDLITCFANDYGYENWVKESLRFYVDPGDMVILISSSGNSQNMINAAKFLKSKKNNLVTFTGFFGKNKLNKFGKLNFIVNSNNYNNIENSHQYWLLTLVDLFIKFKGNTK